MAGGAMRRSPFHHLDVSSGTVDRARVVLARSLVRAESLALYRRRPDLCPPPVCLTQRPRSAIIPQ
eukprot:60571-Lingulodinium_polyedra.AAC.1